MCREDEMCTGLTIADVIRTCLGPQAMLKMLMDPMGGIVMTNDGNAILREITVQHPAGKSVIEIARTQDEEVGDGTTSVIVLSGEMLVNAEPFLERGLHPSIIIKAYKRALMDIMHALNEQLSTSVDCQDSRKLTELIRSCVGTKFIGSWSDLACQIALDAVRLITSEQNGCRDIDIKRYVKVSIYKFMCGIEPNSDWSVLINNLVAVGAAKVRVTLVVLKPVVVVLEKARKPVAIIKTIPVIVMECNRSHSENISAPLGH
ncbi:hypothetical protein QAD02_003300 [Eretmocerus hayati]|uniref:Uncharacterized protein n=1 Tax=Eretmocerus hayati TaxID=131215 RepID=A0ACC2NN52_9HYME|nr:hypothetical protein QAD02_003300 [Eretmocerus hayati]